jgi:basic membrane lipoprotein Med (substrate-binding protein (PBP1-ABC) superfamily)
MRKPAVIVFAALLLTGLSSAASAAELKIAYIPCGQVNDQSWSQAGYMGAQAGQKELEQDGVKVTLDYSESVTPAQVEAAARDYASRGYGIVVLHCGTFADAAVSAAKGFPKTTFLFATVPPDGPLPPNFWAYDVAQGEASFVSGYLSALVSKDGQVGSVGAFDFPVLTRQMEGFRLGARYANPKVKALSTYINSWEDAGKAKEAAQAQIDAGADVIFAATDQAARGVFAAADNSSNYAVASYADQSSLAPKAILVSAVYDFGKLLQNMIVNAYNNKLEPGKFYRYGLNGYSALIPNPALASVISKENNAKVASLIEDIKSGAIKIPELHKAGDSLTFDLAKLKAK